MGWFTREKAPKPPAALTPQSSVPDDTWSKCPECSAILFTRELEGNCGICSSCGYHFRLTADQRLPLLCDRESFSEFDKDLKPGDPLSFRDTHRYKDRVKKAEKKTGVKEAVKTGKAEIDGIPVCLGLLDFQFMGGSMGAVVGEKLTRMIEKATEISCPVIIVSASGGARMQEGIISLMQMAKVSAALTRLGEKHLPYISILTHPTTGGVAASFAMLGDVILAEPKALIGFAGPRVIEQTIRQQLPQGFQRSEFLLERGMVDRIVTRSELKSEVATLLRNFGF